MKKLSILAIAAIISLTAAAQSPEVFDAFNSLRQFPYLCGSRGWGCRTDSITGDTIYKHESMTYFFRIPAGFGAGLDAVVEKFTAGAKKDKTCTSRVTMETKAGEEFAWSDDNRLEPKPSDTYKHPQHLIVATYESHDPTMPRRVLLIYHTLCDDGAIKGMTVDYQYRYIDKAGQVKYFPNSYEAQSLPSTLALWHQYEKDTNERISRSMAEYYAKLDNDPVQKEAAELKTVLKMFNNLEQTVRNSNFTEKRTDAALSIYLLVKENKGRLDEDDRDIIKTQLYRLIDDIDKVQDSHPANPTVLNYLRKAYKLL